MNKIFGVGINDAGYTVVKSVRVNGKSVTTWRCPYYNRWRNLLHRCYSSNKTEKLISYDGCVMSQEWLTFSKFKSWMETQDWEGMELDKDLKGDGKLYSEETCAFIPKRLNGILRMKRVDSSEFPGVYQIKGDTGYYSRISVGGKDSYIGYFDNKIDASIAYLNRKAEVLENASMDVAFSSFKLDILTKSEYYREQARNQNENNLL